MDRFDERLFESLKALHESGYDYQTDGFDPKLLLPVVAAINDHPEMGNKGRFFWQAQLPLSGGNLQFGVARVLAKRGPKKTVEWLQKVYSTERADVRHIAQVIGAKVSGRHTFSNGVTLGPWSMVPDSFRAKAILEQHQPTPTKMHFLWGEPVAAIQTKSAKAKDKPPNRPSPSAIDDVVTALTIRENAKPVVGTQWFEFADPDLELAQPGVVYTGPLHEGRADGSGGIGEVDFLDSVAAVERVLSLRGKLRQAIFLALRRLNLARRRISPGDQAIDGSICLEALFGDSDKFEMTYKIRVRTAVTLEDSPPARREVADAVRAFYSLRSTVVHGGQPPGTLADQRQIAQEGLAICARAIEQVVNQGWLPNSIDVELGASGASADSGGL